MNVNNTNLESNPTSTQTSQTINKPQVIPTMNTNDIGLKIKNVFSVNETATNNVPLLVPIKIPERNITNGVQCKNSLVKVFDLSKLRILPPKVINASIDTNTNETNLIKSTTSQASGQSLLQNVVSTNNSNTSIIISKDKSQPTTVAKPSSMVIEISDDEDDENVNDQNKSSAQNALSNILNSWKRKRKGFVISSCKELGKISAEIDLESITLNFYDLKKDVVLSYDQSDGCDGMSEVNNYLMR